MSNLKGELVRIKTQDNLELHGILFEPNQKSTTALIHVHGWTGNFYEDIFIECIAKALISKVALLTFNTRGAGHVQEFIKRKSSKIDYVKIGGSLEIFEDCILDIGSAIHFLSRRGYKSVILQGHSTGCQKVTFYKYKIQDKRVKGLILLEPTDDPSIVKKMLGKRYSKALEIAQEMIKDGRENKPMPISIQFGTMLSAQKFLSISDPNTIEGRLFNYSGKLKEIREIKCPVLAVFGSNTEYQKNPVKSLEILKRKMKRCDTTLIRDTNHWFVNHETELGKFICMWIKSNFL